MGRISEVRRQRVAYHGGRPVDGEVRVRGFDLQVAGRGIVVERREPVAVVVGAGERESRYGMPRERAVPTAAFLIAPVAAFVFARILSPRRRK